MSSTNPTNDKVEDEFDESEFEGDAQTYWNRVKHRYYELDGYVMQPNGSWALPPNNNPPQGVMITAVWADDAADKLDELLKEH